MAKTMKSFKYPAHGPHTPSTIGLAQPQHRYESHRCGIAAYSSDFCEDSTRNGSHPVFDDSRFPWIHKKEFSWTPGKCRSSRATLGPLRFLPSADDFSDLVVMVRADMCIVDTYIIIRFHNLASHALFYYDFSGLLLLFTISSLIIFIDALGECPKTSAFHPLRAQCFAEELPHAWPASNLLSIAYYSPL